jgi:hypothetical protein
MGLPHFGGQIFVVVAQLCEHILRDHELCIIVLDALQATDLADGSQGYASDLAHALGDRVGDGENLVPVLIQQQMIVAEVRTRNMPVEVLRFEVEGEHIRQQNIESAGYFPDTLRFQIRQSLQGRCL